MIPLCSLPPPLIEVNDSPDMTGREVHARSHERETNRPPHKTIMTYERERARADLVTDKKAIRLSKREGGTRMCTRRGADFFLLTRYVIQLKNECHSNLACHASLPGHAHVRNRSEEE